MTSTASSRPGRRRKAAVWITIGVIVVLVIAFFIFANLYTDVLWYQQLGYLEVLTTQWFAAVAMFFIGFLGMAVPVWVTMQLAYRLRPVYARLGSQVDRYQQVVEPLRRLAMYGIPSVLGLFSGFAAASRWQTVLLWLNATPSGETDPQFHLDTSFYLFDLPFLHGLVGFASAIVIFCLLALFATTYLYGAVRINGKEVRIAKAARVQIAVTAAVYLLLQAVSVWLDRFETVTDSNVNGSINGAAYTDIAAIIPGRSILAGIAALVAILFLVTAVMGRWRLPLVGTALLLVSAIVIGALYPWGVQRLQVQPSQKSMEAPYIKRSIKMTRQAYGLSDIKVTPYKAKTDAESGALRKDATTTANIRILDPSLVSDAFGQLQQFKQFYGFPSHLNVDRYKIDGKEQDAVVSVRELHQSGLGEGSTKYNDTFVYTHGYGLVAAYGNKRSSDGQPVFMESGIPTSGKLGRYQPRIYFGQNSPDYSIVGAPKGTKPIELDFPGGSHNRSVTRTTYSGDGGPKLDNIFNRLVYALKFQDEQILLSNAVNDDSQILYDRDPAERVHKAAPYLTLDSTPYPSIVDGRVVWIVDGYTTSDNYPYSKRENLNKAIADSQTPDNAFAPNDVNYMRNSVKATVDAYSGKVTLYSWDKDDPILQTWSKIFPNTLKPMKDMSGQLLSHVRYPQDLFKLQRQVLGLYHVTNAGSFYSQDDAWVTPNDPDSDKNNPTLQPPYYLTLQMPGQKDPEYSLYSTFIPKSTSESSRNILRGYLAVDSNAGDTKGKKASDYGKLRLLTLPDSDTIPGPGQVQNNFSSDTTVSTYLNLLRQGKTQVLSGNLLTLPVGGGLLYVQPVFIKSTGETSYPLLQKVLVSFGDKIAFEDTLDDALNKLFGGDSGANAGDKNVPDTGSTTPPTAPPSTGGGQGSGETSNGGGSSEGGTSGGGTTAENPTVQKALQDAKAALEARNQAMKEGDWAAYGKADQKLQDALGKALAAQQAASGGGAKGKSGQGSSGSK